MEEIALRQDVRAYLEQAPKPEQTIREIGAEEARRMMRARVSIADLPVGDLTVLRNVSIPGPDGTKITARLFDDRASREPCPILLFFHGGGFVFGDLDTHASVCAEIARTLNLPVLSVDYRRAPEHVWPAASEDCEAVARWVASQPIQLERNATGLILAGDSAGGWLAVVTGLALVQRPDAIPLHLLWLIYPLLDVDFRRYKSAELFGRGPILTSEGMDWFMECFSLDSQHPHAHLIELELAPLPPTVITTAGCDLLRDQGRAYAEASVRAGVNTVYIEAKGQIHGFLQSRRGIPSAADDLAQSLNAVSGFLPRGAAPLTNEPDRKGWI